MAEDRIAAALLDDDQAERGRAYAELTALADAGGGAVAVGVAMACVAPLVDGVLCADASRVGGAEARRASLVLGQLVLLEPLAVGGEWMRSGRWFATWGAPGSALGAVVAKAPRELTRDDLLLAACDQLPLCVAFNRSFAETTAAAGLDELAAFMALMEKTPYFAARAPTDARNMRLVELALEILRGPPLPELEAAAVWCLICMCMMTRPAVCAMAVEAGVLELGMAALNASSAAEWTSWRGAAGAQAGMVWRVLCDPVLGGISVGPAALTELVLGCGAVAAAVDVLRAYERRGAARAGEANVMVVVHALLLLQSLDLSAAAAAPVVALLRGIPGALRFALEHELNHLVAAGLTAGSVCAMLCALVFGKEEGGGGFRFTPALVDAALTTFRDFLSGAVAPFFPDLPAHWFRPVVHLCISDVNKALLVRQGAKLVPLLLDALFLDPAHVRQGAAAGTKAPIQADAADCCLQIAVFEPGRALLAQHAGAMAALRALAGGEGCLTERAKMSAAAALVAIEGRTSERRPHDEGPRAGHVMISYQWDVQATTKI
jgi:hypothetical protein